MDPMTDARRRFNLVQEVVICSRYLQPSMVLEGDVNSCESSARITSERLILEDLEGGVEG
jgi:hypothetical protein